MCHKFNVNEGSALGEMAGALKLYRTGRFHYKNHLCIQETFFLSYWRKSEASHSKGIIKWVITVFIFTDLL